MLQMSGVKHWLLWNTMNNFFQVKVVVDGDQGAAEAANSCKAHSQIKSV